MDHQIIASVRVGRDRLTYALRNESGRWICVKRREGNTTWRTVWALYDDEGRSVETALARIRHQHRSQDVTTLAAGRQWMGEGVG